MNWFEAHVSDVLIAGGVSLESRKLTYLQAHWNLTRTWNAAITGWHISASAPTVCGMAWNRIAGFQQANHTRHRCTSTILHLGERETDPLHVCEKKTFTLCCCFGYGGCSEAEDLIRFDDRQIQRGVEPPLGLTKSEMAAQMGANARWVFWSSSWCVRGAAGWQQLSLLLLLLLLTLIHKMISCEVPFTSFSPGFSLYYRDKQLPTEPCAERGYAGAISVRASICACVNVPVWVKNTGESVAMHFYMSSYWSVCTTHRSIAESSLWVSSLSLMH